MEIKTFQGLFKKSFLQQMMTKDIPVFSKVLCEIPGK